MGWTSNYLKRYGLVSKSKRGIWSLTEDGKKVKEVDKDEVNRFVAALGVDRKGKQASRSNLEKIDINKILGEIDLDKFKYDLHSSKNLGVTIRDIIANAENKWVLPNFQRYYDSKKKTCGRFYNQFSSTTLSALYYYGK